MALLTAILDRRSSVMTMRKTILITIEEKESGLAVKAVLSKKEGLSRREISRLKFSSGILLNGETCRVSQCVKTGDQLKIIFPEIDSIHLGYLPERPEILYEDEDLVLVNKPAGMPCHPSHEHQGDDMGTLLQSYYQGQKFTIRAVGRLDKDVSGVMCYAKNQPSAARLSKERSEQILHKTYIAVAKGIFAKKQGTLQYRLEKVPGCRDRRISEEGKLCITDYKVLKEYADRSLLEISIRTGRTHQIRAGMASLSHPLLGDSLYGGKCNEIARPALHCARIAMKQPFNGSEILAEAPMPDDMRKLVNE